MVILAVGVLFLGAIFYVLREKKETTEAQIFESQTFQTEKEEKQEAKKPAEKIQVFVFHNTHRCSSCIAVGKLAGETVNEYFQPELQQGKIEFREINIDLPENKELASKFQASGSSLYINAIIDGQDNIAEDITVWQLINQESKFKNYLKNKLNKLFGKQND